MKKFLLVAAVAGLGMYIYATYRLKEGVVCDRGTPGVDCIKGHGCPYPGIVCKDEAGQEHCVTKREDCEYCHDALARVACELVVE